jgi:hypothetical protein
MKKKIIYLFIPLLFSCSEAYKVYEVTGVVLDIDEDDLYDWVDQLLATWDDEHQEPR